VGRHSIFSNLIAPGVAGLQPYLPGKSIDELEREYGIADSIKLASNENPLGPPASALAAIRAVESDLALYPDGSGYRLKQALATHHNVAPEAITLGNGSNDLLVLLAECFLTATDVAVFDQYSFVIYRMVTQAAGAIAKIVPSLPANDRQPYGHDIAAFTDAAAGNPRLIFIANPNNPTGTWLSHAELYDFMCRVPEQTLVVIDEAYGEYVCRDDFPRTLEWLAEFPNLVVTRTFSKVYGLAGSRVGYGVSHPDLAEILNRVRQPFNVNSLALAAAEAALADHEFVERSRRLNSEGMQVLCAALTDLGLSFVPSIGNFVLVDMGAPAAPAYEALLRAGIIVRPVANYGLPNHLRMTIGLPEQVEKLVAALSQIVGR
jgi:histidinol-phosphate aminotransferase